MNRTGKNRLLKLADFLERGKIAGRFAMDDWAYYLDNGKLTCGSAACALGWATTIPSFAKRGLRLNGRGIPTFQGSSGDEAGAEFFRISDQAAFNLFVPHDKNRLRGARGRRTVAKRIRKLIATA